MIIGSGQLAQAFISFDRDDVCFFASGVSNSNCTDQEQFEREEKLLLESLIEHSNKKFVYFSSCALSAPEYPKNAYYQHKQRMESLIESKSNNYYIFRLPQLFGCLKQHSTLINFIYHSILNNREFVVYDEAYRYVIEIEDAVLLVNKMLKYERPWLKIDIANHYQYKVKEIVGLLEKLTGRQANYTLVKQKDKYDLDLSEMMLFIESNDLDLGFGENYILKKLESKFS